MFVPLFQNQTCNHKEKKKNITKKKKKKKTKHSALISAGTTPPHQNIAHPPHRPSLPPVLYRYLPDINVFA